MKNLNGILAVVMMVLLATMSLARADDEYHEEPHPERIFINVEVVSAGIGANGMAEFQLSHITDGGGTALFEVGKVYYAVPNAKDNMLALAVWSYTHHQMLRVLLDPNATEYRAKVFQMMLDGPLP